MPRQKTRLSPEEQWLQTARYKPYLHGTDAERDWLAWREREAASRARAGGTQVSEADLRQRWEARRHEDEFVGGYGDIGVITRPHRWFHVGDVLRMVSSNGMNKRVGVQGVSSKGVRLKLAFVMIDHGFGQGYLRIFWMPGSLLGLRWDSEAVRQFVRESRAEAMA